MSDRDSRTNARRFWTIVVGVPTALALILMSAASAAQITVTGRDHETDAKAPCTTTTLPATVTGASAGGNYTAVSIGSIPAACNNLAVSVVVYGGAGASLANGTGNTGATGTAIITTTSFSGASVVGVALLVDTWGVKTTWTPPAAVPTVTCIALNNGRNPQASRTCSVTITASSGEYPNTAPPGGQMMNLTLAVTTTGTHWRVTVNFGGGFVWTPTWAGQFSNEVQKPAGYVCPAPMTSLEFEDNTAFWGTTLYISQSGVSIPWTGQTICP